MFVTTFVECSREVARCTTCHARHCDARRYGKLDATKIVRGAFAPFLTTAYKPKGR